MMTTLVDVVLLAALVLTAVRVALMHRELKRLRGYQMQYVQVFGETSRAADNIGIAVRQIGRDGVEVLRRLEDAIAEADQAALRLEAMTRVGAARTQGAQRPDDIGLYSRPPASAAAAGENENEILKFGADSRRLAEGRGVIVSQPKFTPLQPEREIRLAPSVKTLRAAGANGR